jgi:hypothetical protein
MTGAELFIDSGEVRSKSVRGRRRKGHWKYRAPLPTVQIMRYSSNDTAVVIIDPQNSLRTAWELLPATPCWTSASPDLQTSRCSSRRIISTRSANLAFQRTLGVRSSHQHLRPYGRTHAGGFTGSGADWLDELKPYIDDGSTVIASPHKVWSPQSNDLILQLRKRAVAKSSCAACWRTCASNRTSGPTRKRLK